MRQRGPPGLLRGVDVKARANAKVPAGGGAGQRFHLRPARAGVRRDERQAQLCCHALGAGFGHEGFFIAGETRQIQHGGHGALLCLGRQVDRELHRQPDLGGVVLVKALFAAEAGVGALQVQGSGHVGCSGIDSW